MADPSNPNDHASDAGGGNGEPTVDQAKPYQPPASVSSDTTAMPIRRSPLVWIAVLTAIGAAGAVVVFFFSAPTRDFNMNRGPVRENIEDFGGSRIPPTEYEDVDVTPIAPDVSAAQDSAAQDSAEPVVP